MLQGKTLDFVSADPCHSALQLTLYKLQELVTFPEGNLKQTRFLLLFFFRGLLFSIFFFFFLAFGLSNETGLRPDSQ